MRGARGASHHIALCLRIIAAWPAACDDIRERELTDKVRAYAHPSEDATVRRLARSVLRALGEQVEVWSPELHREFPADCRAAVRCLLLCSQTDAATHTQPHHRECALSSLPHELILHIVQCMAEIW